jgi:hypothetical protein
MKKWFVLIGILVVLLIGGYFILSTYAVKLIQPHLQKAMGPGFTLEEVRFKATCLSAKGIQYEDPHLKERFLRIEEMKIYPSLLSLLKKSLHIKEFVILQPSFLFYRSREGFMVGPWVTTRKGDEEKEISKEEEKKRGEVVEIQIDRIRIQKGSIDFEDRKVREPPAQIELRDVNFEMRNIKYPTASAHSPIQLKAKMKGKGKDGGIDIKGWIDTKTMDMETSLKIRDIEVKTFEPYYRKRVTAEIESGTMDMDSNIAVREKRIDAPGEFDLINLHIKEGGGMVFWIPAETWVSFLEKKGHQIKVKFHVKGNMENPQFNIQETILTQVAVSLGQALGIPIKVIGEKTFQSTSKGEKGFVEGLQSVEELFKKKKEKKR